MFWLQENLILIKEMKFILKEIIDFNESRIPEEMDGILHKIAYCNIFNCVVGGMVS